MSFSRSGSTAPAFSFPIGYGSFTDVNASNAVFTSNVYSSFYHGDGGLLSNVISSIPGSLPNLVVSNSLTTTNVYASNIADQTGTFGTTGQVLTKAVAGTLWAAPTISSQWTTGTGNIYYLSNVGIGTSSVSANLTVAGNVYASNALTTTNVYASNIADQTGTFGTTGQVLTKAVAGTLWAAPTISSQWTTGTGNIYYLSNVGIGTSLVSSNLTVTGNAYVSNALTTTNVYASNIADQTGTFGTTGQVLTKAVAGTLWAAAGGGSSQWTGTVGAPIYYVPQVGIGSSTTPTSNLQVTGNIYASNALTSANAFCTNLVATNDLVNLGQYLTPSTANSSIITQWLRRYSSSIFGTPWNAPTVSLLNYFNNSNISLQISGSLLYDGRVIFSTAGATGYGPGFFNPRTNQYSYMSGGQFSAITSSTFSPIRLPNSNVLFFQNLNTFQAGYYGIFNTTTLSWTTTNLPTLTGFGGFTPQTYGACMGADSNVYMPPYAWSNIGVYNYRTNSFSWVPVAEPNGLTLFSSATLVPDGRIIFSPTSESNIGIFNPTTWTFSNTVAVVGAGVQAGLGPSTLLPNGNVLMARTGGSTAFSNLVSFNPITNACSNIPIGTSQRWGAMSPACPDGRVFLCPLQNSNGTLSVYNWITGTFTTVSGAPNGNFYGSFGILPLLPDGRIVLPPGPNSYSLATIDTGLPVPPEYCYSIFFNKN